MRPSRRWIGLLPLALALLATAPAAPSRSGVSATAGRRAVVLELFTSQGCSSCPPADRLLTRLAAESGGAVVPLAFHVDSWNGLGWRDPFSSLAWTERQMAYTRALDEHPYTPQAVVAGRAAMVGSDEAAVRAALAAAAALPAADLALTLAPAPGEVDVTVAVGLPPELDGHRLHLMLALFETGLETPVERGENGGRTLRDDYVVRRLERAARLRGGDARHSEHRMTLRLDRQWQRANLGVAAFLQDAATLAIHGAASSPLTAP